MRVMAAIAFGLAIFTSGECQSGTELWRAFASKNKVIRWVGREFLVANPYKYKDKVIAFQGWYVGSISEMAVFSDRSGNLNQALSVENMSSQSLKRGEPVVVAVQVSGPDADHESENLSLVKIYRCRMEACSDFAKFNNSGELVITGAAPVRVVIQRIDAQTEGRKE